MDCVIIKVLHLSLTQGYLLTILPAPWLSAILKKSDRSRYTICVTVSNARISIDNNTGTLTISNIQRSDRGRYIIRVMNKYGIDSADYDLTVYCKFVYILNVWLYWASDCQQFPNYIYISRILLQKFWIGISAKFQDLYLNPDLSQKLNPLILRPWLQIES